jgi:hypothetical protein
MRVFRQDLGDDEDILASQSRGHGLAQCATHEGLGAAGAIHLGCVDDTKAHVECGAQGGKIGRRVCSGFAHAPGAQSESGPLLGTGQHDLGRGRGWNIHGAAW